MKTLDRGGVFLRARVRGEPLEKKGEKEGRVREEDMAESEEGEGEGGGLRRMRREWEWE